MVDIKNIMQDRKYPNNWLAYYRVTEAVKYVRIIYPDVYKIYLFGSYLKGYYQDREISNEILDMRKTLNRDRISDIDLMIEFKDKRLIKKETHFCIIDNMSINIDILNYLRNVENLLIYESE